MSTLLPLENELALTAEEFSMKLKLESPPSDIETTGSPLSDSDEETEENNDFTFSSARFDFSSDDNVFNNGPIFPFFDQTLLFTGDYSGIEDDQSLRPPVKTVLVESHAGPYCEWAGNPATNSDGASPETCEKSNSTGHSKMWRFHELGHRSNSDGRDAFVFMKRESEQKESAPAKGHNGNTNNKKGKGKTVTCSAHEMHYVESRNRREKDKMRSYLPYRPGFFGFFTNVRGGLSKNIHPY